MQYKVDFSAMPWETPMPGVRQKRFSDGTRGLRLVEYATAVAPHWCSQGHIGHIIAGRIEITLRSGAVAFGPGDALFIPGGEAHAHCAVPLTPAVTALFVEDA